jgi:hypothetical protein
MKCECRDIFYFLICYFVRFTTMQILRDSVQYALTFTLRACTRRIFYALSDGTWYMILFYLYETFLFHLVVHDHAYENLIVDSFGVSIVIKLPVLILVFTFRIRHRRHQYGVSWFESSETNVCLLPTETRVVPSGTRSPVRVTLSEPRDLI